MKGEIAKKKMTKTWMRKETHDILQLFLYPKNVIMCKLNNCMRPSIVMKPMNNDIVITIKYYVLCIFVELIN